MNLEHVATLDPLKLALAFGVVLTASFLVVLFRD